MLIGVSICKPEEKRTTEDTRIYQNQQETRGTKATYGVNIEESNLTETERHILVRQIPLHFPQK